MIKVLNIVINLEIFLKKKIKFSGNYKLIFLMIWNLYQNFVEMLCLFSYKTYNLNIKMLAQYLIVPSEEF